MSGVELPAPSEVVDDGIEAPAEDSENENDSDGENDGDAVAHFDMWTCTFPAFLRSVGLREAEEPPANRYEFFSATDPDGRMLGYVDYMRGSLTNLKVSCSLPGHKRCGCWVQPRLDKDSYDAGKLFRECVQWLSAGIGVDQRQHQVLGYDLKRSYGMKPKPVV